jgi:AraC-like DNA-binding protein
MLESRRPGGSDEVLTHCLLQRLCRARERLHEGFDEAPSVDELAREAGLSTGQFIRRYAAVFGITPHQHRILARLERARQLLALSDRQVTEVCLEVGFSSLGSFSELFMRRTGTPPSAYRRRARTLIQIPGVMPAALAPGCLSLMQAAYAGLR